MTRVASRRYSRGLGLPWLLTSSADVIAPQKLYSEYANWVGDSKYVVMFESLHPGHMTQRVCNVLDGRLDGTMLALILGTYTKISR